MPTSVMAAVAGAAITAGTTALLGPIGAALVGALFATAITAAFADKPGVSKFGSPIDSLRNPIGAWQWVYGETRVGGTITYIETASEGGDVNSMLMMVITLTGHTVDSIPDVYIDDEVASIDGSGLVTNPKWKNRIHIYKALGSEAVQPFPDLAARSSGKWTDAHRQNGKAKLYVRLEWDNEGTFAAGIPKFSAKVRGRRVYDPRSATTVWSDNWALCMADYLQSPIGLSCDYSEIDEAQLISAANICDESVSLAGGGTEKRYTMNGVLTTESSPRESIGKINTAANGVVRFIAGKWKVFPAAYITPTITITADDLRGPLRVVPRISRRDLCNGVKGLYASPENLWQPADFPPVTNATYTAEDQGERIWRELELPFTDSPATAQRIAKIELEKVRQQISVEWPGTLGCYRLQPGDTVMVTLPRYGWSSKVFEVVATKLIIEEGGVGCDLALRETASSVFDWNSGEETAVDPAPDTNLPNPFTVATPGGIDIDEELYSTRDGRGVAARAHVSWGAAQDSFVIEYQLEYKLSSESEWIVLPRVRALFTEINDVSPGIYDFRVKAINTIGASSSYSTFTNFAIAGLGAPPSAPTGLSLQIIGTGSCVITIDPHPDLDVLRGGRILVRHTEAFSLLSWEESMSIGNQDSWMGDSVLMLLPLKPGTYLVKARDSTGQESVSFASISTKQASVLGFSPLATTIQEDNTFPGTHTDTEVVLSTLRLTETGGAVDPEGTYLFSAGFNFGSVKRTRITGQIEGAIYNAADLIDSRLDLIDLWANFDGTDGFGSKGDCWMEARETDDDPSGSPTWSVWKRVDSAEFECRGLQFRLQMRSYDSTTNLLVDVLRVKADEVV